MTNSVLLDTVVVLLVGQPLAYTIVRWVCCQVEPTLKYERIGNELSTILSRDAASCLAVHTKVPFFAFTMYSILISRLARQSLPLALPER